MKRSLIGVFIFFTCLFITACDSEDVKDQATSIVQSTDEHVLSVKGGHPNLYPNITYEEAFESFFSFPTWKYFKGTQNGPDEDGEPDYINDNIDVVEFTGHCMYSDVEVKALIQFTLDMDNNTFEAAYLSFNDVPQNNYMLMELIKKAFDSYTQLENEDETFGENQDGKAIEMIDYEYSGEYIGFDGETKLRLEAYEMVSEDGAIGYMYMYDGDSIIIETDYYVSEKEPDDFDGAYKRTYVFYDQGYPYYLGFTIQNGNEIWIDYHSENKNIDYFRKIE